MSQTVYDLSACCCNVTVNAACCSGQSVRRRLFATVAFNWTNDPDYTGISVQLDYNSGSGKWEGTGSCNGASFILRVYCSDVLSPGTFQWLFDLVTGGVNYAEPLGQTPGGMTVTDCSPFSGSGLISVLGLDADSFPFCGRSGSETLDSCSFTVVE